MKIGILKGALLEYIIRNLLLNCGFYNVKADDVYTYERGGLFYINGKGAAHDADIIMNPPFQMPFHYPTQLIFECKAYKKTAGLPVVRNVLGLRNDLNDFEIVNQDSLDARKNNRRSAFAIETRNRFLFQVGAASINDFTKPAIEFSANNKIPLISLSWFFPDDELLKINMLSQADIDNINEQHIKNLYAFFKDRNDNINSENYQGAKTILEGNNPLAEILNYADLVIKYSYVGVLETGEIIFLFANSPDNPFSTRRNFNSFTAKIVWYGDNPNIWYLNLGENENESFKFFLPNRLGDYWRSFSQDKGVALRIKGEFLSRIYVFNKTRNEDIPFSVVRINEDWLRRAEEDLNNNFEN